MTTTIQYSQSRIQFQIFGTTKTKIEIWKQKTLKKIWEEQVKTGTYAGNHSVKGNKIAELIMKRQAKAGVFKPIYGMESNCGFRYVFQITDTQCRLTIRNTLAKDTLVISETIEALPDNIASHEILCFSFGGRAFQSLMTWNDFDPLQAITGKYTYVFYEDVFGGVCKVAVKDRQSGEKHTVADHTVGKSFISV